MERLQKYISRCGIASRRKSEDLILSGKVKVNGEIVKAIVMIDEEKDIVEIDGKPIKPEIRKIYILLNKPENIITSAMDQFGRKTVLDLIDIEERVYPVGRLDYDTSGLLILTNDGDIAHKMMHPSHEVNKVYIADVAGIPTEKEIRNFKEGLVIDDYTTSPAELFIKRQDKKSSTLQITIHEGRNRQVRRMCEKIGHPVLRLRRIKFGELELGELESGKWRYLNEKEINYLRTI